MANVMSTEKINYRVPLWKHQIEGIEKALASDAPGHALLFEPGTGKTATAINITRNRWWANGKKPTKVLILTPLITLDNWENEIEMHCGGDILKHVQVLTGSTISRQDKINQNKPLIVITNHEFISKRPNTDFLLRYGFDTLIIDEAHRVKTPYTHRTKSAILLSDHIPYKLVLTGTPILNSPQDIFCLYRIISKKIFGEKFFAWRKKYFYDANAGMPKQRWYPDYKLDKSKIPEIKAILNKYSSFCTKAEALDLPPLVRSQLHIELEPKQRAHYEEMLHDFITYVGEEACVATLAISKLIRLQQIANGFVKLTTSDTMQYVGSAKEKALENLLEDIAPYHKVIIWSQWVATYPIIERICTELGLKYVTLHGQTHPRDKDLNIREFNHNDDVRVLIGNQGAGGIGINLQAASYMIYYSKGFSLDHDIQSEARAHRAGSERHQKITRIDLITKDTVEEQVTEALWNKKKIAEDITGMRQIVSAISSKLSTDTQSNEPELRRSKQNSRSKTKLLTS